MDSPCSDGSLTAPVTLYHTLGDGRRAFQVEVLGGAFRPMSPLTVAYTRTSLGGWRSYGAGGGVGVGAGAGAGAASGEDSEGRVCAVGSVLVKEKSLESPVPQEVVLEDVISVRVYSLFPSERSRLEAEPIPGLEAVRAALPVVVAGGVYYPGRLPLLIVERPQEVFVGRDPVSDVRRPLDYDLGNTLLIRFHQACIHVGATVFTFELGPEEAAVSYCSSLDDRGVPAPVLVTNTTVYPLRQTRTCIGLFLFTAAVKGRFIAPGVVARYDPRDWRTWTSGLYDEVFRDDSPTAAFLKAQNACRPLVGVNVIAP
jgi:hypothetical protein